MSLVVCPNCGFKVENEDGKCFVCGADISEVAPASRVAVAEPTVSEGSNQEDNKPLSWKDIEIKDDGSDPDQGYAPLFDDAGGREEKSGGKVSLDSPEDIAKFFGEAERSVIQPDYLNETK